jgi:hypothetical protein
MSYTRIPELPAGGIENGYAVDVNNDLLVLEQDITRKITPLSFLSNSIAQLNKTSTIVGSNLIPLSDLTTTNTANLTINNLMDYINHHLNVIHQVFYVNNVDGIDATDYAERGKNIQLPFKTISFAARQVSEAIAADANYKPNGSGGPNYVPDPPQSLPAVNSIRKQYSIFVTSGDYTEQNPIYIPPNTTLIGDSLRRTTIRPANPYLDILWLDNACYVWGFTFRDHKSATTNAKNAAAATAFPISYPVYNANVPLEYAPSNYSSPTGKSWVQDSYENAYLGASGGAGINPNVIPKERPRIYVSPYVQGCTSYAISDRMPIPSVGNNQDNPKYPSTWSVDSVPPPNNAGMGMRIDGSLVQGFIRSMVIDSFTQVNQGGWGIYLINNGYAQFVSTFTVATEQGIVCEAGGTCSVSTSNSTFGLSGLVARGRSYSPVLSGTFVIPGTPYAYPTPSQPGTAGNTYGVYGYSVGGNLFTINNTKALPVYYPGDGDPLTGGPGNLADTLDPNSGYFTVATQPYATLCFTVGDDKPWITNLYDVENKGASPIYSGPGYLLEDEINPLINRTLNGKTIHEVKLFYIEQGAPTPSLSGGKTNSNSSNYDIYQNYQLSIPNLPQTQPTAGLPWDIYLSYNLAFNLTRLVPLSAYDIFNNPIQYNISYDGKQKPIFYKKQNGTLITSQYDYITTTGGTIDFTNAPVKFYARSVVETGSHTFEYMGTGTRIKYAIPAFGGVTTNNTEAIADGFNDPNGNRPGTVFFTSSNELGNFKVGTDFTIVQSTGTIQGDTFNRAILTLVTPLNIVLE